MREHGYLDDAAFAETYARLRQQNEKLGVRRVRQDLKQKGVESELITETLEARYGQTNEEALAREHLERRRMRKPENEKETARIMRRLVAAAIHSYVHLLDACRYVLLGRAFPLFSRCRRHMFPSGFPPR